MSRSLIAVVLVLVTGRALSQDTLTLDVMSADTNWEAAAGQVKIKSQFSSRMKLEAEVVEVIAQLRNQGFLESSMDSLVQNGHAFTAWIHLGGRYEWVALSPGDVEPTWLHEIKFKERVYPGRPVRIEHVRFLQEQLVDVAEDHGYPFASAFLDSVVIDGGGVSAALAFDKNVLVHIDTIVIHGQAELSLRYVYNYVGIEPGDPYSESRIASVDRRLKELPFVKQTKPPQVIFIRDEARIDIFLEPKKVSRFNFILGILPNSASNDGKLLLTGDLDLDLRNELGVGDHIQVRWKQLKPRSPEFDVYGLWPYVAWLPIGVDARFQLYKRDSAYLDLKEELGVRYSFVGYNYLKAFVRNESSSLIYVDTAALIASKKLPAVLDWKSLFSGLEFHAEQLDYRFNPRRGWFATANAAAGYRTIKRNAVIRNLVVPSDSAFSFEALYDSAAGRVLRGVIQLDVGIFIPVAKRMTLLSQLVSAQTFPEAETLDNELIRAGGNHLIRGFDEETFLATSVVVLTAEWRYLLAQNSFFRTFVDAGYVRQRALATGLFEEGWPFGIGLGLAFETKAGVFALSYALGRMLDQPDGFEFRNAKVHLGYVNIF